MVGMIMGSGAYMAPEQARGHEVDRRADIWAFGVVLYEMLTGRRLFRGEDITEILASVVKEKPDLGGVPAKVRPLLERCLEKDPKKRLRDIGDAMPLIDVAPAKALPGSILPWAIATGALVIIAAAVLVVAYRATRPVSRPLVRVSVDLGPDATPAAGLGAGRR